MSEELHETSGRVHGRENFVSKSVELTRRSAVAVVTDD